MAEPSLAISAVLQIPQVLDSLLRLLEGLRNHKLKQSEYEKLVQLINTVRRHLNEFAAGFDELKAWKELHNICTKLRQDLHRPFSIHQSLGRSGYCMRFTADDKESIMEDLDSMNLVGGSMLQFDQFTRDGLSEFIPELKELHENGAFRWREALHFLVHEVRTSLAAEEPDAEHVYDALFRLRSYIDKLTQETDSRILRISERFILLAVKLKEQLAGGT